tara:strand:- start:15804 stop:17111 length:1308 start_codon:yes stop_codon:yes gene_type:complete
MGFFNVDFDDVLVGTIEGIDEGLTKDIARTRENEQRLRDITYTTRKTELQRFNKDVKDNAKKIDEAAAIFEGDVDAIYSLVKSEGSLDAAIEAANVLKKQSQTLGISPKQTLGLAEGGTGVTAMQLAKYTATPVNFTDTKIQASDTAVGLMRILPGAGEGSVARIEQGITADLKAAGLEMSSPEEALKDVKPALTNKLRPYMLGRVADPSAEIKRLAIVAQNLKANGKNDEATEVNAEMRRVLASKASGEIDEITPSFSRLTKADYTKSISDAMGLGGNFVGDAYQPDTNQTEILMETDRVSDVANELQRQAVEAGVDYGIASRRIRQAIRENVLITFEASEDGLGGQFELVEGTQFFNTSVIRGAGGGDTLVGDQSATSVAGGSGASAGSINSDALNSAINELSGLPDGEKEIRKRQILKIPGGRQALEDAGML